MTETSPVLSHDQITALDDIDSLFNSNSREQILTGSPGTGKSFLTAQVIDRASKAGYQLVLAATTHPAVKVLSGFTRRHVLTLHKLLDLKVINDYTTNTTHIHRAVNKTGPMINQLMDYYSPCLLIIDEASYIDKEMHIYIENMLEENPKVVILYVGDKDQLPPIGSEVPYVFSQNKPTSILTTDHRYSSDSQMSGIVKKLKSNIQDKSYFLVNINTGHDISVLNDVALTSIMHDLYTSKEYKNDPYHVKSMAYRNKVVDNINEHVRGYFYSEPTYQEGERLILNSPLVRKRKILANNGDIVTVIKNHPDSINDVYGQMLVLETEFGDQFTALSTKQFSKKNTERRRLVEDGNWKALYAFMEGFIEVKDMYASTIHKAQGATYRNVILHLEDLIECQDHTLLARLLLVAVSRASEHVYVYGSVPSNLMR